MTCPTVWLPFRLVSIEFVSLLKGSFLCPSSIPENSGSVQSHSYVLANRSSTLLKTSASALGVFTGECGKTASTAVRSPASVPRRVWSSLARNASTARTRTRDREAGRKLLGEDAPHPKGSTRWSTLWSTTGFSVKMCCCVLGVSSPGYYRYRARPLSRTQMRRQWLTGLIREVHEASRGTYGSRRIHAELTMGMGVVVSERLVAVLMSLSGIRGLPGPAKVKKLRGVVTADDLVNRKFHRLSPNGTMGYRYH